MNKMPAPKPRERFPSVWTLEDIDRFLATFDKTDLFEQRNYTMAMLTIGSGLRAGEIAYLRPIDVNLQTLTFTVSDKGKTGARTAVIPSGVANELARWMRRRERELHIGVDKPLFPLLQFVHFTINM